MEHRTSAEFKGFAEVIRPQTLSTKELLERWALALERREGARLRTLRETEYKPVEEQSALREENSPLTVAFEDPILRSAGLTSDRLGDVARFLRPTIAARRFPQMSILLPCYASKNPP